MPRNTTTASSFKRGRGMFGPGTWKGLEDIADGTCNTVAVSESGLVEDHAFNGLELLIKNGAVAGVVTSTSDCRARVDSSDRSRIVNTGVEYTRRGTIPWMGMTMHSALTTVLPPNSHSCRYGSSNPYDGTGGWYTPISFHSGGVNAGLADGSVRFITETINCETSGLSATAVGIDVESGPSPFGVWGAYGSADGGESQSL